MFDIRTSAHGPLTQDLINLLMDAGAVFNTPRHIRDGYIAHCTHQAQARLHEGDTVILDNIAIIDMFPGGDSERRRVSKILPL